MIVLPCDRHAMCHNEEKIAEFVEKLCDTLGLVSLLSSFACKVPRFLLILFYACYGQQAATLAHRLMMKAQRDERRGNHSAQWVMELKAQVAEMAKLEDLQHANQRLQGDLEKLQGRFEASESWLNEEAGRCRGFMEAGRCKGFMEAADSRDATIEAALQALQFDLATKQSECHLKAKS